MEAPPIKHRALDSARKRIHRIENDLGSLSREAQVEGAKIAAAEARDAQAREQAAYDGRPEPKPSAPDRKEAAEKVRVRLTALNDALERGKADLDAAREAHQRDLLRQTEKAVAKAESEYQQALGRVRLALMELQARETDRTWVERGSAMKAPPVAWSPSVTGDGGEGRARPDDLLNALEAREIGYTPRIGLGGRPLPPRPKVAEETPVTEEPGGIPTGVALPDGEIALATLARPADPLIETLAGGAAAGLEITGSSEP